MNKRFEDFLTSRNDDLDNAAYHFMRLMLALPEEEAAEDDPFPWDMQHIGEAEDCIEAMLKECGLLVCHPYYEGDDETPCYKGTDCQRKTCPFKENHSEGE